MTRTRAAAVSLACLVGAALGAENCRSSLPSALKNLEVHGLALGVFDGAKKGQRVPLGGVSLQLRDAATSEVVAQESTSRDGAFDFTGIAPGKYKICWQGKSWLPNCDPKIVEVIAASRNVGVIGLVPREGNGASVLQGHIELADGNSAGFTDPMIGIDDRPAIRILVNGKAVAQPVPNISGDFLVGSIPSGDTVIEVKEGDSTSRVPVTLAQMSESGRQPIQIAIPNHAPRIVTIAATDAGHARVSFAEPGATITVTALVHDEDSDILQYRWYTDGGSSRVRGVGSTVSWTLPSYNGLFHLHLVVFDSKGGYSEGQVAVAVGPRSPQSFAPAFRDFRDILKNTQELLHLPAGTAGPSVPSGGAGHAIESIPGCPQCPAGGPFLSRLLGSASKLAAEKYYDAVDPTKQRLTLGGWWQANGFTADGGGGIRAAYLNYNDLGFGRDMNCLQRVDKGTIACYVTNYGSPDQSLTNADLAATRRESDRVATVAMEYAPIEAQEALGPRVKFFAYVGGVAQSERITAPDLDGAGEKPVPQLCITCHGGNYSVPESRSPTAEEVALKASFREFDLASLRFTGHRGSDQLNNTELEIFRQLNQIVLASKPAPGISELIHGWYDSNPPGKPQTQAAFLPAGWSRDANTSRLYTGVVAPSCRTCHIAFRFQAHLPDIDWTTYQQFALNASGIQAFVCGQRKSMPHALITFRNFWQTSHPRELAQFAEPDPDAWEAFGSCD